MTILLYRASALPNEGLNDERKQEGGSEEGLKRASERASKQASAQMMERSTGLNCLTQGCP